ncbi:salicylate 1-hydroxylase-like protein [Aaosphaeria arxii CBS 175.79]|uniref:Salicylate 1-hydroxylase-like protein n=1 Tax=Aaosphaeria arxii CBS 175.79 TaxID=1450172 RepID=A0A6A5Y0N9_9PLEO|nr:salicylate 1-hydroxylase-like protein [Aaosphaeria arxii CBS 175.79]KAF2018796.1 salicylate 1-hydroxylase-like protein [Aaosphaeria arxii CBS 175.79]
MSTSSSSPQLDIAIVGGGIAGCVLSIALSEYKIKHTLYESASRFGEIGAGVGFENNFVRVMELISPSIKEAFLRCIEPVSDVNPTWISVAVGDTKRADENGVILDTSGGESKVGDIFFTYPSRPGPRGGIHRAHFLDELVKLIPDDVPSFGKRLVNITSAEDGSDRPVLQFADGSTAIHSAVIGCDGIKSRTREILLGIEEAARPVFSGKYAYRGLIPMGRAIEIMGEEKARKATMYLGYHRHVLTFPIAKGSILNVVAFSSKQNWTDEEWVVPTSREAMVADYETWIPEIKGVLAELQRQDIWALFQHLPASTYFGKQPRICLVGDAAHASTPFNGAGAGMCVEDCYILSSLLSEVQHEPDLCKVFSSYDEVRRSRSQRLVQKSIEAGMLYEFEGPQGDDIDALISNMTTRMNWIWDFDLRLDLERAQELVRGSI